MDARTRVSLLGLIAALSFALPVAVSAATSASVPDPVGDSTYYAPDLGNTAVTVADDGTINVNTRITPRPPAGWGGCAYYVAGTCIPADITVTWYLDSIPGAGSLADNGADAKVVVIPRRGLTTWESSRWDAANGKYNAGAKPASTDDTGGVTWKLYLTDLGIPSPSTIKMRIVSLYKSYTNSGELRNYTDTAGPGSIAVAGGAAGAGGPSAACTRAVKSANKLRRQIRKAKRQAKAGSRPAKRRLKKLRAKRRRVLRKVKRLCVQAPKRTPTTAKPGCMLVTKPVFVFDENGRYVLEQRVVVECKK